MILLCFLHSVTAKPRGSHFTVISLHTVVFCNSIARIANQCKDSFLAFPFAAGLPTHTSLHWLLIQLSPLLQQFSLPGFPSPIHAKLIWFSERRNLLGKGKGGVKGQRQLENSSGHSPTQLQPRSLLVPVFPSSFVIHCNSSQSFLCFKFANQSACLEPYQMFSASSSPSPLSASLARWGGSGVGQDKPWPAVNLLHLKGPEALSAAKLAMAI